MRLSACRPYFRNHDKLRLVTVLGKLGEARFFTLCLETL